MKSLCLFGPLLLAVLAGCAQLEPERPHFDGKPYYFAIEDGVVELAVQDGQAIPMKDFIKLAQRTTGKVYVYMKSEIERADTAVQFVGTVSVPREKFFAFVRTMLMTKGFACVVRPDGAVEIKRV